MDSIDLKMLNFRESLLNLLEQYDCEISGTGMDDGSMVIYCENNHYILEDSYNLLKDISHGKYENVMKKHIVDVFSYGNRYTPEDVKGITCIFSDNIFKVNNKIREIYNKFKDNIEKFINSSIEKEIILQDGSRYIWVKPNEEIRGLRCDKAIIDEGITLVQLYGIVLPVCDFVTMDNVEVF